MELRLAVDDEHGPVRLRQPRRHRVLQARLQAGLLRGDELALDSLLRARAVGQRFGASVAVQRTAYEARVVDPQRVDLALDGVDCMSPRIDDRPRDFVAPFFGDRLQPAAQRGVQVAGRAGGGRAADAACLEQRHRRARGGQAARQCGSGDPAADDDDVGQQIVLQPWPLSRRSGTPPDGLRVHFVVLLSNCFEGARPMPSTE